MHIGRNRRDEDDGSEFSGGEDFDVDIEVDIEDDDEDDDDVPGEEVDHEEYDRVYGRSGVFGPDGPFGRSGPFGPDGPFGPGGPFGPRGPFGSGGFGQGKRRRRRKRMVGPGDLRLVLLAMISEEPRHGYELIKAIEEMTGGAYSPSPGTLYPTLSLLEDEGLIEQLEGDDNRKAYKVTAAGAEVLEEEARTVDRLMRRFDRHGRRDPAQGAPDLFRSLGNLAAVLTNRAATGGFDDEARREIVDLIDEVAKKIERL